MIINIENLFNTKVRRTYRKNGTLKSHYVAESGYRYYSQEQLNHFFGLKNNTKQHIRIIIGYCRV